MGILSSMMRGTRWERLDLPPIETTRLRIAPLALDEAEELRRLTDDPAITGAVDFLPEQVRIEDAYGLIRSARNGRDVFHGVRERAGGELVGVVGTHLRAQQAVEIGYWVGGFARGRGYGAESVGAVVRALANRYPRRAVVAECRPENAASWQMLHTLGFRPTGDGGHRPGRKLVVWDIRQAPQPKRVEPAVAARVPVVRPDGGLG